jgi:DNA-binding NarL/FixJ family response regulator
VVFATPRCDDLYVSLRVLIVDDHPGFRRSARRMLELDGFEVVGEAEDGASAVALARELRPDVVLLDIALPDRSGFDVADELRGTRAKIVLVSSRDRSAYGSRIAAANAVEFIPKDRLSAAAVRAAVEDT